MPDKQGRMSALPASGDTEFTGSCLKRAIAPLILFLLVWAVVPAGAHACEVCWGASVDTPTTRGIGMAMLALIGMTGVVGGGIGAFFYNIKRRSDLLAPGGLEVTESGAIHSRRDADETSTF